MPAINNFNNIKLQIKDKSGNWLTVGTTVNTPMLVRSQIESLHKFYKSSVRALDKRNSIVDIIQ